MKLNEMINKLKEMSETRGYGDLEVIGVNKSNDYLEIHVSMQNVSMRTISIEVPSRREFLNQLDIIRINHCRMLVDDPAKLENVNKEINKLGMSKHSYNYKTQEEIAQNIKQALDKEDENKYEIGMRHEAMRMMVKATKKIDSVPNEMNIALLCCMEKKDRETLKYLIYNGPQKLKNLSGVLSCSLGPMIVLNHSFYWLIAAKFAARIVTGREGETNGAIAATNLGWLTYQAFENQVLEEKR